MAKVVFKRLNDGDDLVEALEKLAEREGIGAALVTVVGMVRNPSLGYYSGPERGYVVNKLEGVYELASCTGNVSLLNGKPFVHLHAVVASPNGEAKAGHVLKGTRVANTCEVMLVVGEVPVERRKDEKTGLYLLEA